ncbi:hypothetical protein GCM10011571_05640 [Marinithermofilum abyssi]|uniref:Uncharacterized protein n=1 Tax=Marinithermofilum abyssi TaxID=1571185 RepID=A0A8J2VFB8_9BACL|nr:hypothetical protein [Marinithermofilum abyssi]GGE07271.1 hypothetical protein GCM10011571_05640 [Marinithermofilum abyssi]
MDGLYYDANPIAGTSPAWAAPIVSSDSTPDSVHALYGDTNVTVSATVREIRGYDSETNHQTPSGDNASDTPDRVFVSIRFHS